MKIILDITIAVKGAHVHSILRKEYDTELIPIPGIEIEDSAWKEPKKPVSISCNFDEGYYLLNFPSVQLNMDDECEKEGKMYRLHGWKSPSETV